MLLGMNAPGLAGAALRHAGLNVTQLQYTFTYVPV